MRAFPRSMIKLIEDLGKMPGIGPRSAQRLTFHILQSSGDEVESLLRHIREVKDNVKFCAKCNNLSEGELCGICSDSSRDRSKVCVVEGPNGVITMEKSGVYNGLYHVLLGELSPIEGVGPDELHIDDFVRRVEKERFKEVIIATDFTTEGETTALYLSKVLKATGAKVSRLARGVPAGAMLEYADMATLQRAIEDRKGIA